MGKKSKIIMGLATAAMIPAILTGCGHKEHDPKDEWKTDETYHWHECEESKCDEQLNKAEHEAATVYSHNETHHWKECTECAYDLSLEQHTFDKEVVESKYLKTEATATTKAVYYKSCICGEKGTETFESGLKIGTISNLAIAGKVYDGTAVNAPTYDKNTDGVATIEYKLKTAADTTYTTVAPINAGEYTARVSIAESTNYTSVSETKDFTIAKKALTEATVTKVYDGTTAISNCSLTGKCTGLVGSDVVTLSATLNSKDVEDAESVTNIQLAGTGASNYTLAESEVTATVTKFIFKGLNTTVEYNGNNIHYIDMSLIEAGLRIEVTFDGASVISNATGARVLEGEVESTNFGIDVDPSSEEKCTVAIVAKKVGIVWTAPVDLAFDGTDKTPTAAIDGLVGGDSFVPEIALCVGHDNITYGSSFQFEATFDNQNYEIISGEISDVYTVSDIEELEIDSTLGDNTNVVCLGLNETAYYKASFVSGKKYYFYYDAHSQGGELSVVLYKVGSNEAIYSAETIWTTMVDCEIDGSAFDIKADSNYYIKITGLEDLNEENEGQLLIIEDEHTEVDTYGHCVHCGAYQGETESINSNITVTFEGEETLYYRFKIDYNLKHRIVFASGEFNYTAYRVSFAGDDYNADVEKYNTAEEIELDGTLKEFEGSDYIYLVITKKGTTSSATVQLEESSF